MVAETERPMLRLAILFLIISLIAGGFGLANISAFTRKISFILFGLFFLGFLLLLGFALLVTQALSGVSLGTEVFVVAALALD
jgi:uncharacterized membrane protein YtjA (UPF0391 family)